MKKNTVDVKQTLLKDRVKNLIYSNFSIHLSGDIGSKEQTLLKNRYHDALAQLINSNDKGLIEDLLSLINSYTSRKDGLNKELQIEKDEFLNNIEYRTKKIKKWIEERATPFKNLNLSSDWGENRIREIAIMLGENYESLSKLAVASTHVTTHNTHADAILSSREFFMTQNRLQQLESFKTKLDDKKLLLISGERGNGKTLFMNAFIQKSSSSYNQIIYFTVKAGHIIEGFVKSIEDYLGVQIQSDESSLEQLRVALMLLKDRNLSGLICIDNANTPGALETFLKEWEKYPFLKDSIHLVITTYCRTDKAANFSLESLKENEAKEIFDQYVKNEAKKALKNAAIKLFADLGFIPILVEQVSLLIENNQRLKAEDLSGIHGLLKKKAQEPVIANPEISKTFYDGDEKTVIGFIQVLFSRMAEKISDDERLLLQYFSLLPAKAYSEPELIDLIPLNENDLDRIDELVKKGWLLKKGDGFYCHELYQIAIRELFPIQTAEVKALLVKIEEKIRLGDVKDMERSVLDVLTYASYAENIVENLIFYKKTISLKDNDLNQKLLELENCSGAENNDHVALVPFLISLGIVNFDLSLWDKALYYYYNALRMQLRLNQQNSWKYARHLGLFANLIRRKNKQMALQLLNKSLEIIQEDKLTPTWVIVRQYTFLGRLYRDLGLFHEAEAVLKDGLIACDNDVVLQFDKATILDNLGLVYGGLGRKDATEQPGTAAGKELSEKSLKYRKQALTLRLSIHSKKDNLKVASLYNNIGAIYSRLERVDESIKAYEECLRIRKKLGLPEVHNGFAIIFNNLAHAKTKKVRLGQSEDSEREGLLDEAYILFEKGLAIREQLAEKDSSAFGFNYFAKSSILFEKGKLRKDPQLLNDAKGAGLLAIAYKNKVDVPVQHEIKEIENLIEEIDSEMLKHGNETN